MLDKNTSGYYLALKRSWNFFDDDDDDDNDFETFADDKDFAKMTFSNQSNDKMKTNGADEQLGRAWGGEAYSIKGSNQCYM